MPHTDVTALIAHERRARALSAADQHRRARSRRRRRRPTMLGVWAHPDDEAYLSAGLMARFVGRGGRVVVLTATRGEAGTDDPATWPPPRLAARRSLELRDSLRALGVDEHHVLGLPDGGCAGLDHTHEIAGHIERVEPDLIVTFGPDGLTGHDDHRAVSRWATAARATAAPEADLWYATVTPEFHERWGAVNHAVEFFYPDQPDRPSTPVTDLVHHAALPDDLAHLKVAALAAHTSQTRHVIQRLGLDTYREWWRTESFVRAEPPGDRLRVAGLDADTAARTAHARPVLDDQATRTGRRSARPAGSSSVPAASTNDSSAIDAA